MVFNPDPAMSSFSFMNLSFGFSFTWLLLKVQHQKNTLEFMSVALFVTSDYTVEEQPSEMMLIQELESSRAKPLVFVLNANLLAMVKLVNCRFPFWLHCA